MKLQVCLASLMLLIAPVAQAATVWATSVEEFVAGAGTRTPSGDNPLAALGAPTLNNGDFASLGDGGYMVVRIGSPGKLFNAVTLFEGTTACILSSGTCDNWPEQANVYVSPTFTATGMGLAADIASNGFTLLSPTVQNGGPITIPGLPNVRGTTLASAVDFSFVLIHDLSAALVGTPQRFTSNSAFDVVAVGGTPVPVPLPAAGWMLISALGGVAFISRRRKAA